MFIYIYIYLLHLQTNEDEKEERWKQPKAAGSRRQTDLVQGKYGPQFRRVQTSWHFGIDTEVREILDMSNGKTLMVVFP